MIFLTFFFCSYCQNQDSIRAELGVHSFVEIWKSHSSEGVSLPYLSFLNDQGKRTKRFLFNNQTIDSANFTEYFYDSLGRETLTKSYNEGEFWHSATTFYYPDSTKVIFKEYEKENLQLALINRKKRQTIITIYDNNSSRKRINKFRTNKVILSQNNTMRKVVRKLKYNSDKQLSTIHSRGSIINFKSIRTKQVYYYHQNGLLVKTEYYEQKKLITSEFLTYKFSE